MGDKKASFKSAPTINSTMSPKERPERADIETWAASCGWLVIRRGGLRLHQVFLLLLQAQHVSSRLRNAQFLVR